ncbi:MAG: sugar phosphate isomerase/epimerase [bacterium]|nr:MAG: sugar phosphate isomerase/epimerase [bacterium]
MNFQALHGRAALGSLGSDLDFLDSHGLGPEIYLPGELLDDLDGEALSRMVAWREAGRQVTFHAPFVDLSPAGLDPRVLEITRYRFRQVMELARTVLPRQVVFHPGFDRWRFGHRHDLWLENSLPLWEQLVETGAQMGVGVVLENVFDTRPDHFGALRQALGNGLGFCLDTGHLLLFSEVPLEEWLDTFGDALTELHLHDNDGKGDLHLPLGEGKFDFADLCRQIRSRKLEPVVVLEHHSRDETRRSLVNFQTLLETGCPDEGPGL